jgi:hypothetical protein
LTESEYARSFVAGDALIAVFPAPEPPPAYENVSPDEVWYAALHVSMNDATAVEPAPVISVANADGAIARTATTETATALMERESFMFNLSIKE